MDYVSTGYVHKTILVSRFISTISSTIIGSKVCIILWKYNLYLNYSSFIPKHKEFSFSTIYLILLKVITNKTSFNSIVDFTRIRKTLDHSKYPLLDNLLLSLFNII